MDSFDEQPVPDLNSEALDFGVASELFAPYKKLTPMVWKALLRHDGASRTPGPNDWRIAVVWSGPVRAISGRLDSGRAIFREAPRHD